jgi:transcriptional regulator with XRE-family HTH domain
MTTRGERLRAYLLTRTGGYSGWQRDLVQRSGVKRQTISKWTASHFDGYPDPEALADVARALEVRPFEIVAAIDGDAAVSLTDPRTKDLMRDLLEELLAERDARRPPRTPPGGDPAA